MEAARRPGGLRPIDALTVSIVIITRGDRSLDLTLQALKSKPLTGVGEVLVIDASGGRLDDLRVSHPEVHWCLYDPPAGISVTIPHQRNLGVRCATGDVVVFLDCGCIPDPDWFEHLLAPIWSGEEQITCGPAHHGSIYAPAADTDRYVEECATINLAFVRGLYEQVGPFDESFAYGSDVDFSWRVRDAGVRIRWVAGARVQHSWGDGRRQLKRSFAYGEARARLYQKHAKRRRRVLRTDPLVVVYPLFLLGLPLAVVFPLYLSLLFLPLYRSRCSPHPSLVVADHLVFGAGVLRYLIRS